MIKIENLTNDEKDYYEFFHSNILKNSLVKPMKMTDDKEKNFKALVDFWADKNFKNYVDFANGIYKTYVALGREEEVFGFLKLEDMRIKKTKFPALYEKFMKDFLFTEEDKHFGFSLANSIEDSVNFVYEFMLNKMAGNLNCFYFDFKNDKNVLITKFVTYILNNGYTNALDTKQLFFKNPPENVEKAGVSQERLKDMYVKFVENVAENFRENFNSKFLYYMTNKADSNWKKLKFFKNHLEEFMTEETKESLKEYIDKVSYLNDDISYQEFKMGSSFEGRHGEYYITIKNALTALKNIEENKQKIGIFLEDTKKIRKALLSTDKPGKIYPVNYFKVTDIDPGNFLHLINLASKLPFEEKEQKLLAETKDLIRRAFTETNLFNKGKKEKIFVNRLEDAVSYVQMVMGLNKTQKINEICEKELREMPEKVKEIMREEDLPITVPCIKEVFNSCIKGEKAVCLQEEPQKISKDLGK